MSLSDEDLRRLARLGYVTEQQLDFWKRLSQEHGRDFFARLLRREEEAAEEYERWFPSLQMFASECRQRVPVPDVAAFSHLEMEQFRVLQSKMEALIASPDGAILTPRPYRAVIIATTRVGLAAAVEVLRRVDGKPVLLTEEERARWFSEIHRPDPEGFWWYAFCTFSLVEGAYGDEEERIREHYPIPEDNSYWTVTSGIQWGSLAGGARRELWRWDGARAESLGIVAVDSY